VIVPRPKRDETFQSLQVGLPIVGRPPALQARFAPDGRVSVAWPGDGAQLATLSGTAVIERSRVGGTLRTAEGLSLLTLADGRRALAWTNQDRFEENAVSRVHYAVEGAPVAAEPKVPRVTVGRPRERALRPAQSLVLPIRCSAACDLSVRLPADDRDDAVEASLSRAGTVNVTLAPPYRAIAPARPGPVSVIVRASGPGASTATRTVVRPRLRRVPALPFPRIESVRGRRLSNGRVEVRWRMSSDARDTLLSVTGTRTRDESKDGDASRDALWGLRRTSYRVVLKDAAKARFVHVTVSERQGRGRRTVTVRVR